MIYLNHLGIVCPLGNSCEQVKQRLLDRGESGVSLTEEYSPGHLLPLGRLDAELPLPQLNHLDVTARSRNNQVALAALAQIRTAVDSAIEHYGKGRFGIVLGTSTSGIAESEAACRHYARTGSLSSQFHYGQQELGSLATLLAEELDVWGPAYVHSSACASSAKALASAARLLRSGACDAVLTGGVDTLCGFTVAGFASLESVSTTRCNPLSRNRNGINIGEGGALFLMSHEPGPVTLRGWGESSDGYHVSAPDPSGAGARLAIERALSRAGISAESIQYINLHGTGTVQNDAMEARVIHELFGDAVAVSSTKPLTGHPLGAAGAIEAGLCWLAMQDDNPDGRFPPHLWDGIPDPTLPVLNVAEAGSGLGRMLDWILSNSFGFGGANAALVFGRA